MLILRLDRLEPLYQAVIDRVLGDTSICRIPHGLQVGGSEVGIGLNLRQCHQSRGWWETETPNYAEQLAQDLFTTVSDLGLILMRDGISLSRCGRCTELTLSMKSGHDFGFILGSSTAATPARDGQRLPPQDPTCRLTLLEVNADPNDLQLVEWHLVNYAHAVCTNVSSVPERTRFQLTHTVDLRQAQAVWMRRLVHVRQAEVSVVHDAQDVVQDVLDEVLQADKL